MILPQIRETLAGHLKYQPAGRVLDSTALHESVFTPLA